MPLRSINALHVLFDFSLYLIIITSITIVIYFVCGFISFHIHLALRLFIVRELSIFNLSFVRPQAHHILLMFPLGCFGCKPNMGSYHGLGSGV